jgi:flagellar biosynthesis/type III secretory pathway protein FliH
MERELRDELYHLEEAHHMPYVTSIERLGRQEGFEQGLQQGQIQAAREVVLAAIAARFGSISDDVLAAVQRLESREALHTLLRQAMQSPTLEALREVLCNT